jgi:hypothetical protein
MTTAWQTFEARIVDWVSGDPPRIPFITGGCQSGRTEMLTRVRARIGPSLCQSIDLSRITSTPERFVSSIVDDAPFPCGAVDGTAGGPARAYARALDYLDCAEAAGAPATFLLDEILDIRVFESFPGLKTVVRDTLERLVASRNRFVLTTRFTSRALRVARDLPDRLVVQSVPALQPDDVAAELQRRSDSSSAAAEEFARAIISLTDGRYGYVRELTGQLAIETSPAAEPVSVLARLMAPGGALADRCAYSYELRLNRTRGYGTLRAILAILADEEPLTLTEIAHEMQRTPGSTKDYLSWLEDVDLVAMHHKRYAFTDPLLRLWVRLNGRREAPSEERLIADVQRYALERLS